MVGNRRSGDDRDTLYMEVIKVAEWCNAKMVVLENVAGFASKDGGLHLHNLTKMLEQRFDVVESRCLNALDYAAPQNWRRLIVVAHSNHRSFDFPNPIPCCAEVGSLLVARETVFPF